MAKKIVLILLFFVLVIIGSFFGWRYVNYLRDPDPNKTFLLPRVRLSQVEITSITATKTEVTAKFLIKNILPFSFVADSVQFIFFIQNTPVIKSRYKKALSIKSADSSLISFPMTIINRELLEVLKSNERKNVDSVQYRIQAFFFTNILFIKKLSVDMTKLMPLYHVLEVKAGNIKIDSLNFSRVAFRLLVTINNKNGYSLQAKNIAYEFSIDKLAPIQGVVSGVKKIESHGITELQIPLQLPIKNLVTTLLRLLSKGKNANYKLRLFAIIDSDNGIVKDSKVTIESTGVVGSLQQSAKK